MKKEKKIKSSRERTLLSDSDLKQKKVKILYWIFVILLLIGTITAFLPFVCKKLRGQTLNIKFREYRGVNLKLA